MNADNTDHPGIIFWTKFGGHDFGQLIKSIDELCYEKTAEELCGIVTYL